MSLAIETVVDDSKKPSIIKNIDVHVTYNDTEYRKISIRDDDGDKINSRIPYGELSVSTCDNDGGKDSLNISLDLPNNAKESKQHLYSIRVEGACLRPYYPPKEVTKKLAPIEPVHAALYNPSLTFYRAPTSERDPYLIENGDDYDDENEPAASDDNDDEDYYDEDDDAFHGNKRRRLNAYGNRTMKRQRGEEEYVHERRLWVQCDRCTKWRQLPSFYGSKDLPKKWFCELNPDPEYNNCNVDQEVDNDNAHTDEHTMDVETLHVPQKPLSRRVFPEGLKLYQGSDKYCSVCYQVSAVKNTLLPQNVPPLVGCAGPCTRSYHPTCVGRFRSIKRGYVVEDADWFCNECLKGQHVCYVCGELGSDGEKVIKCHHSSGCSTYFHPNCVPSSSMSSVDQTNVPNCAKHHCRFCCNTFKDISVVQCVLCSFVCHDRKECRPQRMTRLSENSCVCPAHPNLSAIRNNTTVNLTESVQYAEEEDIVVEEGDVVGIKGDGLSTPANTQGSTNVLANGEDGKQANGSTVAQMHSIDIPTPHIVNSDLTISSFGNLILGDSYRSETCYYPIGWKSIRSFRRVDYHNEIHNNGSTPIFKVRSVDNKLDIFEGKSPDEVWNKVVEKLQSQGSKKRHRGSRGYRSQPSSVVLPETGAGMFGLTVAHIHDALEELAQRIKNDG